MQPRIAWYRRLAQTMIRHKGIPVGGLALLAVVLMALAAPLLTSIDPTALNPRGRLSPPSEQHLFGTDNFGRDVFSRTVWGARLSLEIGFFVSALTVLMGTVVGLMAGFFRRLDTPIMRLMDSMMAFPGIVLAIGLMAALGPSTYNVMTALTVVYTPRLARVVRSIVLSIREMQFVEAARAQGTSSPRILLLHILPNCLSPLIVQGTFIFAEAVLGEASLSFLGAGTPPYIPSWGNMLGEARAYLRDAPWTMLFPGLSLTLADAVLTHVHTPTALLTALVFVSGLLSALLVNDTVCVMLAPFVIAMIERSDLPVRPYLFALATGANIGSVMTVVGNPQNMIIAHAAPLSYVEFARVLAPIGVVSLGLTVVILRGIFRHDLKSGTIELRPSAAAVLDRPLLIKTSMCLVLVLVGFVSGLQLAWTALGGAALLLLISGRPPRQIMAQVDGPLLLFFGALFVIVAGLEAARVLAVVSRWVYPWFHAAGLLGIIHFSWVSVLASNVVSNVPYVLVAAKWVAQGADPHRLWLLLALTSTFAGNLTLFGSVANVIVFETARAHVRIGFWEFLRIGAPLTLLTTAAGVALLLVWS